MARLGLIFVPFPKLARRLGHFVPPSDPRALAARARGPQQDAALAEEIGWAVTRSARYVPFKAVCLPQAMAARVMLKRRGVPSVHAFRRRARARTSRSTRMPGSMPRASR